MDEKSTQAELNTYRNELAGSLNALHEKIDVQAIRAAVMESKVDGINKRLDALNGSVVKHAEKIMELDKKGIELSLMKKITFGFVGMILFAFAGVVINIAMRKP